MIDDQRFIFLLIELYYSIDRKITHWIRQKDNSNQYRCIIPNGFEILIDSYTVMDNLNINVSIFLNKKLVVERVECNPNKNSFDYAYKLYKKISEVDMSYEDGIVLEILRYLWSKRRGV